MDRPNAIKELRAALNATSNSGGFEPGFSSADLTARINSKIEDATVKFSELYNMIPKESIPDVTYIWNVRTSSNTSGNASFTYSESGSNTGTPAQGAKVQLSGAVASAYVLKNTGVRNSFRNIKFIQASTHATATAATCTSSVRNSSMVPASWMLSFTAFATSPASSARTPSHTRSGRWCCVPHF